MMSLSAVGCRRRRQSRLAHPLLIRLPVGLFRPHRLRRLLPLCLWGLSLTWTWSRRISDWQRRSLPSWKRTEELKNWRLASVCWRRAVPETCKTKHRPRRLRGGCDRVLTIRKLIAIHGFVQESLFLLVHKRPPACLDALFCNFAGRLAKQLSVSRAANARSREVIKPRFAHIR